MLPRWLGILILIASAFFIMITIWLHIEHRSSGSLVGSIGVFVVGGIAAIAKTRWSD